MPSKLRWPPTATRFCWFTFLRFRRFMHLRIHFFIPFALGLVGISRWRLEKQKNASSLDQCLSFERKTSKHDLTPGRDRKSLLTCWVLAGSWLNICSCLLLVNYRSISFTLTDPLDQTSQTRAGKKVKLMSDLLWLQQGLFVCQKREKTERRKKLKWHIMRTHQH